MEKLAESITNVEFENGDFYFKGDPNHQKIGPQQAEAITNAMDELGYFVAERAPRDLGRSSIHR